MTVRLAIFRGLTKSPTAAMVVGLVIGLVAFCCFDPVLCWIGRWGVQITGCFSVTLSDMFYLAVATHTPDAKSTAGLLLLDVAIVVLLLVFTCLQPTASTEKGRSTSLKQRGSLAAFYAMVLLIAIVPLGISSRNAYRDRLCSGFHACLKVLAPQLSEQENKTLTTRFKAMSNKADYDAVVENIQDIASKKGIKLPPNCPYR